MSDNIQLYKANIGKEVDVKELETLIASSGALIQRVDQAEGRSVVFFSGDRKRRDDLFLRVRRLLLCCSFRFLRTGGKRLADVSPLCPA